MPLAPWDESKEFHSIIDRRGLLWLFDTTAGDVGTPSRFVGETVLEKFV